MEMVRRGVVAVRRRLLSRENLVAVGLCALLILLVIVTSDRSPHWIYQGF